MLLRVKKGVPLFVALLLAAGCVNDGGGHGSGSQVVAKVNGREITTSFVERRIKKLSPMARKALQSQQGQKEFVDSLVSRELLLAAAKTAKIDESQDYITQVEDYKKDLLVQMYLRKKLLSKRIEVTDEEIKEYFLSHGDYFKEQPELRLSHIFLPSRVEAEEVLQQLKSGADFAALAKEKSINRMTAARGGDMGFVRKWQLPPDMAEGIFALEVGQLSDVISSEFGYTVLKITDKRMGQEVGLEAISNAIRMNLMREKQRDALKNLVEALKKKAEVTVNESVLAALNISMGGEMEVIEKKEKADKKAEGGNVR